MTGLRLWQSICLLFVSLFLMQVVKSVSKRRVLEMVSEWASRAAGDEMSSAWRTWDVSRVMP